MNPICKKCSNQMPELNFSEEILIEIWALAVQDMKIFVVKRLIDEGMSHMDAKIIVDHLNSKYGKCNRCKFEDLEGENVVCPKCQAFNYNLKDPVFNEAFCLSLEYALDFDDLGIEAVKGFWCDGIDHFPFDLKSLSKTAIQKNKEILTKAWIGKDGQDVYEMSIRFGEKAVEHYVKGEALTACIPDGNFKDWITIDTESKRIVVKLN